MLLVAGTWSVAAQAEGTHAEIITLDGKNLTIENLVKVAQRRTPVQIDPAALERVKDSFKLIMMAAEADHPIYGLTRDVGENKDKPVKLIENGKITDEGRARSEQFNRNPALDPTFPPPVGAGLRARPLFCSPRIPPVLTAAADMLAGK